MRIDAHHHLWRYNPHEFAWIDERSAVLQRDFLTAELREGMASAQVDGSIAVQARTTVDETDWLLEQAVGCRAICGVVGWVALGNEDLPARLDRWRDEPLLAGFREITQAEPAGYLDQTAVHRGMDQLTERGYSYDLLVRADQLEESIRFADRHPRQRFVLDHAAKPDIARRGMEPWRTLLLQLGQRENVSCKLSGLVTEAEWNTWTPADLKPYLDVCMEAFGPSRLMAGSDWPVCLTATSYAAWWSLLEQYLSYLGSEDRENIMGSNALRFYQCTPRSLPRPPTVNACS